MTTDGASQHNAIGISRRLDMPNIITYLRYALATTVAVITFTQVAYHIPIIATMLLFATFGTDVLDGKLARRNSTRFAPEGRVVDSAADSYTFIVVFAALVHIGATSAQVLLLVILTRAIFDLTRFISLACGQQYAAPTLLTKAKGLIYAICTLTLFGGHVAKVGWLEGAVISVVLNAIVVVATLIALISFMHSHGAHLTHTFRYRSGASP
jgi:phosphatidylglycerophosphate synthase